MAKVLINGKICEEKDATLPALDWGFLYGYGLFETMRAYNGRIFRLDEHIKRLRKSAEQINLNFRKSKKELSRLIDDVLSANNLIDAYVRLTVTYGVGGLRLNFSRKSNPNFFIIANPLPEDINDLQNNGVVLGLSKKYVREPHSLFSRIKSTNYLTNVLAKKEAQDLRVYDVLLLNSHGLVCETSTANIFAYSKYTLTTPKVDSGLLPGITRKTIIKLAYDLKLDFVEREITLNELIDSEEVFITNSIMEVLPVVSFEEKKIGDGKPGETTKKLLKEYKKLVIEETK